MLVSLPRTRSDTLGQFSRISIQTTALGGAINKAGINAGAIPFSPTPGGYRRKTYNW